MFEALFRRLGLSVDWSLLYATIDARSRRASQRAFLRNLARGEAYSQEAPTMWDVDFQTAVAQAEMEDRERPGAYHQVAFARDDGAGRRRDRHHPPGVDRGVRRARRPPRRRRATSRCSARPSRTPLYGVEVPIVAHELAQPDKGTGIAMICTFGDVTDVIWWRELDLPTRAIIGRNGRVARRPAGRRRRRGIRGDRRRDASSRRSASSSSNCATSGALIGDAAPDRASGQVLREGRPPARDRRQPPVVHPQRRPLEGAAAGS